jgi:hypothetical protein
MKRVSKNEEVRICKCGGILGITCKHGHLKGRTYKEIYGDKLVTCGFKNGDLNISKLPEIREKISIGVRRSWENPGILENHLSGAKNRSIRNKLENELKMQEIRNSKLPKICECGFCGELTKWNSRKKEYNDFFRGHKNKDTREKVSLTMLKRHANPEFKTGWSMTVEKIKETKKLNPHKPTEEENRKRSETLSKTRLDMDPIEIEEWNRNISISKMGHPVTKETREKISFAISNLDRPVKTKLFYSEKNKKELYYHSSYEFVAFQQLEIDDNVLSYERCFSIKYVYEDQAHRYSPDILVTYKDGSRKIIEVKPNYLVGTSRNQAKFWAAQKYSVVNGLEFEIWTENKLFSSTKGGDAKPCVHG